MRILSFVLFISSIAIPHTHAFTFGNLLMPSYMCGLMNPADGTGEIQPSTMGGVFKRFAKGDALFIQNNQPKQFVEPLIPRSPAYIIASFHDRNPDVNFSAPLFGDDFKTIGINLTDDTSLPVTDDVTLTLPLTALPPDNTIMLGQTTNLLMYTTYATYNTSRLNFTLAQLGGYDPIGYWAPTITLQGLILYATDDNGNRIGSFVSAGYTMTPWSACGPGDVGIIHTDTIDGGWSGPGSIYPGIVWLAPYYLPSNVTRVHFKGYGVSNHGFGSVAYTFNLNRYPTIPTPTPLSVAAMNTLQCGTPSTNPCFAACSQCASKSLATSKHALYTCSRVQRVSNVALNYTGQYQATCLDMNTGIPLMNITDLAKAGTPVNEQDFASILQSPQYYMNSAPAPTSNPTIAPTTPAPTSQPTCQPTIVYVNQPPPSNDNPPGIPTPAPGSVIIVARNDATITSSALVALMMTCVSLLTRML